MGHDNESRNTGVLEHRDGSRTDLELESGMKLTKPASEYTRAERRALLAEMTKRFLAKFTPSMGDKYSAKQIDRAKGLAWSQMRAAGF